MSSCFCFDIVGVVRRNSWERLRVFCGRHLSTAAAAAAAAATTEAAAAEAAEAVEEMIPMNKPRSFARILPDSLSYFIF